MIRAMLEGGKVQAPPALFGTYRAALEPWAIPTEPAGIAAGGQR